MNEMFKDLGDSWKNCDRSKILHKQSMQILKEMSLNTTLSTPYMTARLI